MADLEKLAVALTGAEPDIFEVVHRGDYDTEDSYIDALTSEKLRRSAPDYAETRRMITRQLQERDEARQRKEQAAEYSKIRASVKLDSFETQAIDRRAREMAGADVMARRISAADLSEAIEKHKKALTEQKKDSKAAGIQFNNMVHGR
ncbi:MAG: hypothetical protein LUE21_07100 [Oscillospiraceae bacterium]|nr:hypothetical protein [Oscillospiraceae bacterium]